MNRRLALLFVSLSLALAGNASAAPDIDACPDDSTLPASMRALRLHGYGGPDKLTFDMVKRPDPSPGEVLIEMRAASVNPIDWKLREGQVRDWWPLELPAILGRDGAGVVVGLGEGVDEFQCGQAVVVLDSKTGSGTFSQYMAASVEDVAPKPRSLSFAQAAAYPLAALTALDAVEAANIKPGDRVLVQGGAGGVGSMAVQIARARGATVIATASGDGIALARRLGAAEVIDYKKGPFEAAANDIDAVIDTVGGETLTRSVEVPGPGGRVVSIAGTVDMARCAERKLSCPSIDSASLRVGFAKLDQLFEAGEILVEIEDRYSLEETGEALERNRAGHARGKLVIEISR